MKFPGEKMEKELFFFSRGRVCFILSGNIKEFGVITSYSIHYTKLYEFFQVRFKLGDGPQPLLKVLVHHGTDIGLHLAQGILPFAARQLLAAGYVIAQTN